MIRLGKSHQNLRGKLHLIKCQIITAKITTSFLITRVPYYITEEIHEFVNSKGVSYIKVWSIFRSTGRPTQLVRVLSQLQNIKTSKPAEERTGLKRINNTTKRLRRSNHQLFSLFPPWVLLKMSRLQFQCEAYSNHYIPRQPHAKLSALTNEILNRPHRSIIRQLINMELASASSSQSVLINL